MLWLPDLCCGAEGIIFIYLGMDALDPNKWHAAHPGESFSAGWRWRGPQRAAAPLRGLRAPRVREQGGPLPSRAWPWVPADAGETISLCGALLLLLLLARGASVLPVVALHNWLHPAKLSTTDTVIIW